MMVFQADRNYGRGQWGVDPAPVPPENPRDVWLVIAGVIENRLSLFHGALPSGQIELSTSIYTESRIGAAPVWPRAWRDGLLAATDKWDLASVTAKATPAMTAARAAYRQALRDLPATCPDPLAIVWPTKPE